METSTRGELCGIEGRHLQLATNHFQKIILPTPTYASKPFPTIQPVQKVQQKFKLGESCLKGQGSLGLLFEGVL